MRDRICWFMFVLVLLEMLALSLSLPCVLWFKSLPFIRKKPSLLVTIGLVHGDCNGVVWQDWCRGPWLTMMPLRPTTGEPTASWLYGPLEFLNLSILLRGASTFNEKKKFIYSKNKDSLYFALFLPVRLLAIASSWSSLQGFFNFRPNSKK